MEDTDIVMCVKCNGVMECFVVNGEFALKCGKCGMVAIKNEDFNALWNKMKGKNKDYGVDR